MGNDERMARITALKQLLAASDYKALKYAEGFTTAADYAPIRAQRQAWREEINLLEAEMAEGGVENAD